MFDPLVPTDSIQRLAVKLKAKSESFVRQGHPWIFESSIVKINKEGKAGDIAIIFDRKKNKYIGLGLYDPHSPIRIKLLASGEKANINQEFFNARFQEAYFIRASLVEKATNAFRLIYGENDKMPGLIVDVYKDVAVIKLYSAIWFPYLHMIVHSLSELIDPKAIVLRLSRLMQKRRLIHLVLKMDRRFMGIWKIRK